jgi:hypothetical protein
MSTPIDYNASNLKDTRVLREESSLIVAINSDAQSSLEYTLPDPFVAEPGELFELAINSVFYQNSFPTIWPDANTIEIFLRYEGPADLGAQNKGFSWAVLLSIEFPVGENMDIDAICEWMNLRVDQLFTARLTTKKNFSGDNDTAAEIFSQTSSTYAIQGIGRADIFVPVKPTTAPTYAVGSFQVPIFAVSNGKIVIQVQPPDGEQYMQDVDADFNWYYSLMTSMTAADVNALVPPAGTLSDIYISTAKIPTFPANIANILGFETTTNIEMSTDVTKPHPGPYWYFSVYDPTVDADLANAADYWTYSLDQDEGKFVLRLANSGVALKEKRFYAQKPANLSNSFIQIASRAVGTSQAMIGVPGNNTPGSVLLTIPVFSTQLDEKMFFAVQNRIFYPVKTNAVRTLPLALFLDARELDLSLLTQPFFVEIHVRRYYDPTSDRSRSNAPLRADPYVGFRSFHGTNPSDLSTGSFRSTHR